MNAFTSPAPSSTELPLTLSWQRNFRGQLESFTRADTTNVTLTHAPATTELTDVTFQALGVVHRERLPMTGGTDWVSAPNGCRTRTLYEQGELVPIGTALESVPGQTCPVTGTVTASLNAVGEVSSVTVAGTPAVSFVHDTDADRLLTSARGMTLTPDYATGSLTASWIVHQTAFRRSEIGRDSLPAALGLKPGGCSSD